MLPAFFRRDTTTFDWPGILWLIAPTPLLKVHKDAGVLVESKELMSLTASLTTTREQFSDLLRVLETKKLKTVRLQVAANKEEWIIESWDASVA